MSNDPTAPLAERTPEQIAQYVDDHIIMALVGAEYLHPDRDTAEDYVRDRLVAMSDSWPERKPLESEDSRRRMSRLGRAIFGSDS